VEVRSCNDHLIQIRAQYALGISTRPPSTSFQACPTERSLIHRDSPQLPKLASEKRWCGARDAVQYPKISVESSLLLAAIFLRALSSSFFCSLYRPGACMMDRLMHLKRAWAPTLEARAALLNDCLQHSRLAYHHLRCLPSRC
jgi:hypothetical protein